MKRCVCVGIWCLVSMAACGGGEGAAPSPTVSSVTVTSPNDMVLMGQSEQFSATVTLSNGTTQPATGAVWGTDERGTASVEPATGRVTMIGPGNTAIYANVNGVRGGKTVRSVPNFQGTWSGSYSVDSCTQSGQFALSNPCGNTFSVNRVLPMNLVASQTRDSVNAQLFLGTIAGSGTGPISTNGRLTLAGTVRSGDLSIDTVWGMESTTLGRITGAGSFIARFAGLTGEARLEISIRDLNRTSSLQAESASRGREARGLADILPALMGELR
jgi:Bacterial Ig-like domain (group 2)